MPQVPSVPFETDVLPEELRHLRNRRQHVFPGYSEDPARLEALPPSRAAITTNGQGRGAEQIPTAVAPAGAVPETGTNGRRNLVEKAASDFEDAHRVRAFGMGFSGGGIRSATFNLGILQGLAERGLLPYVDYLSTVSGGGYIGSWLHGVIHHRHEGDPRKAAEFLSPEQTPIPDTPGEDPVSFLRKYSNYLAPRPGLFSPDTWVIALIWFRNVLLNQLILLPAIAAVILLLLIFGYVAHLPHTAWWNPLPFEINFPVLAGALLALAGAAWIAARNLRLVVRQTFSKTRVERSRLDEFAERWSLLTVPLVLVAGLLVGCGGPENPGLQTSIPLFAGLALLFTIFQVRGGFHTCFRKLHPNLAGKGAIAVLHSLWMIPVVAAVTTFLIHAVWVWTSRFGVGPWQELAFATPLVCLSLIGGTSLLIGLMGADFPDAAREWMARIGAMVGLACAAWTAIFVLAVFGPWGTAWLFAKYGAVGAAALGTWILATAGGVMAGHSGHTSGETEGSKGGGILDRVIGLVPVIFMFGYLLLIAFGVHMGLRSAHPPAEQARQSITPAAPRETAYNVNILSTEGRSNLSVAIGEQARPNWLTETFKPIAEDYPALLDFSGGGQIWWLLAALGCALAVTFIASSRINVNEFSLHHFYKNRLVRCYLGASRGRKRDPNVLTGFDPEDDFPISTLVPEKGYRGPYAIVNTALNLNTGSELAKQERKGTSFVFTPAFCGFNPALSKEDKHQDKHRGDFDLHGYKQTAGYAFPSGPNLGTTVAISGAAANPNSGYHTSATMAFLLTIFDARLGWWLGNPRWRGPSTKPGPLFALRYIFAELFGQTTGRSKFINLSDGGHFDNLGLYELVRRRCRYIIVGDGEQDGDLTFGSLGAAIRMCRADFGVEIDINPDPIRIKDGFSKAHCVVGRITYPESEAGFSAGAHQGGPSVPSDKAKGWLLYLKSSLSGDEPADVIEYRSRNKDFPHQSTGDQFFSESQFESYRRLGLHILRDTFEGVPLDNLEGRGPEELLEVFQKLTRKWYAPIPVTEEAASRLADQYSKLMERLGKDATLMRVYAELLPGKSTSRSEWAWWPPLEWNEQAFLFGLEVIQLIENVYTEFKLEHAANRANPRNAGWIGVFMRWSRSHVLYNHVWSKAKNDYNPLFQQFMEGLREQDVFDVPMRP